MRRVIRVDLGGSYMMSNDPNWRSGRCQMLHEVIKQVGYMVSEGLSIEQLAHWLVKKAENEQVESVRTMRDATKVGLINEDR